jgi:hypothetical protein
MVARRELIHRRVESVRVFHIGMHKAGALGKMMKANQIIVLTLERDERIFQMSSAREKESREKSK